MKLLKMIMKDNREKSDIYVSSIVQANYNPIVQLDENGREEKRVGEIIRKTKPIDVCVMEPSLYD